ncbi:Kanadaptin [Perkinsus chesapeaki]|uniref:Signal recognition particle receptor subunit beta n=1 Tax=Perkinsus chesapeaki TaxID=330153 RepID=A0A7J6MM07_PERCH|nr:Kanadaptin [Perkinsus chesapeaki]
MAPYWLSEGVNSLSSTTGLNEVQSYWTIIIASALLLAGLLFASLYLLGFWSANEGVGSGKRGKLVMLAGPCGGGKTAIFSWWKSRKHPETVSSMRPNREVLTLPTGKCLEVVDFPGHRRLKFEGYELLRNTACICYVMDSTDRTMVKEAAESLYDLFTNQLFLKYLPPVLLVLNKQDLPTRRTTRRIIGDLNKEIEQLRTSRGQVLEGENEADNSLGVEGEAFDIEKHAPVPVQVAEYSALTVGKGAAEDSDVVDVVADWVTAVTHSFSAMIPGIPPPLPPKAPAAGTFIGGAVLPPPAPPIPMPPPLTGTPGALLMPPAPMGVAPPIPTGLGAPIAAQQQPLVTPAQMGWCEVQTSDGRVYYFHPTTKESTWDKPRELQSELEKANNTEWKEYHIWDGRSYFYNTKMHVSCWEVPPEVRKARGHLQDASMTDAGSTVEEIGGEKEGQQKANKTGSEKRADFREMLSDNGVDSSWKWSQVADLSKRDMRYHALPTMGEKKQVFAEYILHGQRMVEQRKRDDKRSMMYDMVKALQGWNGMSEDTKYDQLAADSSMSGQEWWGKLTERERMTLFEAFADDYCDIQKKNRQARDERNMQQLKKALKESSAVSYDMSMADLAALKQISCLECWQQLQPNQRITVWRTCIAAETRRLKNMIETGPAKLPIYLELIVNGQVIREIDIRDDRKTYFLFGRDPAVCDIPLHKYEPRSSRHHAVLQFKKADSKCFYLYDLNSTHGTVVDGKRIPPAEVDLTAFRQEAQAEREVEKQRHERDRDRRRAMRRQERDDRRAEKIAAVVGASSSTASRAGRVSTEGVFRGVREDDGLEEAMMEAEAQDELSRELDVFDETGLQLDTRKLEQLDLTDKQRQLLLKIADKRRKLEHSRELLETAQVEAGGGPGIPSWRNTGAFEDEVERIKSTHQRKFQGDANKLNNKVNRMETELQTMTDNLLLSLGIKNPMKDRMKREELTKMYDTDVLGLDEDDDYYDQATAEMEKREKAGAARPGGKLLWVAEAANVDVIAAEEGEFDDLPDVSNEAETAKTLTDKKQVLVSLLRETVSVVKQKEAQIVMKKASAARADSLDAYMVENEVKLLETDKEALEERGLAIKERLERVTKLLKLAMAGSVAVDEVEQAKKEQHELEVKRAARAEALAAAKAARKEEEEQNARKKARTEASSTSIFGSDLEADDLTKAAIEKRSALLRQQQKNSSPRATSQPTELDLTMGGLQGEYARRHVPQEQAAEEEIKEDEPEDLAWPEVPMGQYEEVEESSWVPPDDNDEKQEALRKKLGY